MISHIPGKVIVAAHRGVSGANIPCNSKTAFNIALTQGADIVEIDVTKSVDGELFVFHPGMERMHLNQDIKLTEMTAKEISEIRYVNQDNVRTSYKITPLAEMLDFLKDKAYINVDKYWMYMEEIVYALRKAGVEKQAIGKITDHPKHLEVIKRIAPDIAFMPMVWHKDEFTDLALQEDVKYIGVEALFDSEDDEIASDKYIEEMHKKGLLVYGNAIVYDEREIISAGHTDDIALAGNPDYGWGWFVDKKFDVIQTDWCGMLKNYLQTKIK